VPKLTDDEQRAIIARRLNQTFEATDSELREQREKALDFYHGRPLGNERPGRAQVVSRDIMETIEWAMPSLMEVFCTRDAVTFDPVGPDDEALAKQETQYIRHVFWKKNPGFMILYTWIKDALMQKNGYVFYEWEDTPKATVDEYSGLSDDQLLLVLEELQALGEVDILASDQDAETGTWSIKVRLQKKYGCAKVMNTPPEEVIISDKCRGDVKSSPFVGRFRRDVTRSELLTKGFPRKRVEALTSYDWRRDISESLARDTVSETLEHTNQRDVDWASEELQLLECWTYIDTDDDGITELRHYLIAGNDILENEEVPEIPGCSLTTVPVPHRHVGLSTYDLEEDLQRIQTALKRGLLDNTYFTMNPRNAYDKNRVDVRALGINRPGGHIPVNGDTTGAITPIVYPQIAGQLLQVIDHFDMVKENRTGVGRMTSGVEGDVLARTTKGAYVDAKAAANQRIKAMCRIIAETGYADLFKSLHRLCARHQDYSEHAKLGGEWTEVSPLEWQERENLTVTVGTGNVSGEEARANLGVMAGAQEKAAAVPGLIQPRNVYTLFRRTQAELGFEHENFITDPDSPEYADFMSKQGQQPDPYIEGEKIKAQTRMQEKQVDAVIKTRQMDQDAALKITDMEVKSGVDLAKAGIGAEVAIARGSQAQGGGSTAPAR
jgi:hypothetical protein